MKSFWQLFLTFDNLFLVTLDLVDVPANNSAFICLCLDRSRVDGGDSQGESEGCQQCDQISATLGNFSKSLATSYLHNSPTFLGIFCKGVKIFGFSSEII